jgi:hypothetical protein
MYILFAAGARDGCEFRIQGLQVVSESFRPHRRIETQLERMARRGALIDAFRQGAHVCDPGIDLLAEQHPAPAR